MKKVVCVFIALLLCFSLLTPAFAAEGFVPSISYKDGPSLVTEEHEDHGSVAAWLVDTTKVDVEEMEHLEHVLEDHLYVTPISVADNVDVPEEYKAAVEANAKVLKEVYKKLAEGKESLPLEKFGEDAPKNPVIRELFDVTLVHDDQLNRLVDGEDVGVKLKFNLGIKAGDKVFIMSYQNGKWDPAVDIVNNGDGTVTCVLPHLCPVAVVVEGEESVTPEPPQTSDESNNLMWLWILLAVLCAFAIIIIAAKSRKKKETN